MSFTCGHIPGGGVTCVECSPGGHIQGVPFTLFHPEDPMKPTSPEKSLEEAEAVCMKMGVIAGDKMQIGERVIALIAQALSAREKAVRKEADKDRMKLNAKWVARVAETRSATLAEARRVVEPEDDCHHKGGCGDVQGCVYHLRELAAQIQALEKGRWGRMSRYCGHKENDPTCGSPGPSSMDCYTERLETVKNAAARMVKDIEESHDDPDDPGSYDIGSLRALQKALTALRSAEKG